jgi:hypothetical protein
VLPPHDAAKHVRIACVSDTHTQEELLRVPPADLLVHAGGPQRTAARTPSAAPLRPPAPPPTPTRARSPRAGDALFKNLDAEQRPSIERVAGWLGKQRCRKALYVGGNHEVCLDEMGAAACKGAFAGYVEDEMVHFDGLRIWATPLSRPYKHGGESEEGDVLGGNKAFQANSFGRVAAIPESGVDVLITHGAPRGVLDTINGAPVGCPVLARKVRQLAPRLHIFGHVHCQGGAPHGDARVLVVDGTIYVNACNLGDFAPKDGGTLFPPVVIDLPKARPAAV